MDIFLIISIILITPKYKCLKKHGIIISGYIINYPLNNYPFVLLPANKYKAAILTATPFSTCCRMID